jgi:hypothetical protein
MNKNLYRFLNFRNAPLMNCRHFLFPSGQGENILEKWHLLEKRYILNFFAALLVSYYVPWLFYHCSNSNTLKIAKKLLDGPGEIVKFVCGPQVCFPLS